MLTTMLLLLLLTLLLLLLFPPLGVSLDVVRPEPESPGVVVNVIAHERADEVVTVVVAGLHAAGDRVTILGRS